MATIVPVSHSQRWRSRSRNQSADTMELQIHVPIVPDHSNHGSEDNGGSDDNEDEECEFDNVQTAPWLVVPQGFASPVQSRSSPVSPALVHTTANMAKTMEMRRASGF